MLTAEAARVLGCLLEKERTTPDAYPLSLNALVIGCNQATNRIPVVSYSETTVESALDELRAEGLVRRGVYPGSRVIKYRHVADEVWGVDRAAAALVALLLLRGPQTVGELKGRSERLHEFADLVEVEDTLRGLAERDEPLVTARAREPGQKEARWETTAVAAVPDAGTGSRSGDGGAATSGGPGGGTSESVPVDRDRARPAGEGWAELTARLDTLEGVVVTLQAEMVALRNAGNADR